MTRERSDRKGPERPRRNAPERPNRDAPERPFAGWLDEKELRAWRGLQLMQNQLSAALNRELTDSAGLSYIDYLVLAALTDRPDGRMRAFELGRELGWEKSRVSHHISRMSERGLVERQKCSEDRRGAHVAITKLGRKTIENAAPGHVASVRRRFLDLLSKEEVQTLAGVSETVLAGLAGECEALDD
ncbi:MAG TPA: MarR family winged helix-turn-helix transcriptional regulator [Acidimicrobiales bacterium]|nr:MarR family winged helix-turn-helix transcriptional regulator [Acidimicrobiales bacterium]